MKTNAAIDEIKQFLLAVAYKGDVFNDARLNPGAFRAAAQELDTGSYLDAAGLLIALWEELGNDNIPNGYLVEANASARGAHLKDHGVPASLNEEQRVAIQFVTLLSRYITFLQTQEIASLR
jgi:hypothetical protein